jgi:DNA-binding GntR family transcriptional regulator
MAKDDEDAVFDALFNTALEISKERSETQRRIKALLEKGNDEEALRLMREHLNVVFPKKSGDQSLESLF